MNLLDTDDLLDRFFKRLGACDQLDFAVAYCCGGPALDLIIEASKRLPVRALIGISDFVSAPTAIRNLSKGKHIAIQLVDQQVGRFHPKAFVFHGSRPHAWIGSANLTEQAFSCNTELVFESTQIDDLVRWFESKWKPLAPRQFQSELDEYEVLWDIARRAEKERRRALRLKGRSGRRPELHAGLPWDEFVQCLVYANAYWSRRYYWSVLGDTFSYLETISDGHAATRNPWRSLSLQETINLVARNSDDHNGAWALLGSCGKSSTCSRFRNDSAYRHEIWKVMQPCIQASAQYLPQAAETMLSNLASIEGISSGVGTRLLALCRPEAAVSVNSASRDRLAIAAGLAPTTLGTPRNYRTLLEWLAQQPFIKAPQPASGIGRQIWPYRAALVDALVYDP